MDILSVHSRIGKMTLTAGDVMGMRYFTILDETIVDGEKWYSIEIDLSLTKWLAATFVEKKDYFWINSLKGVWIDCNEAVATMIILKWS